MSEINNPKVFISYSWSSDEVTLPLAERLMSHGVNVMLDKWDLKEGQDKYAFMEHSVNDPNISKVLIICNRIYSEKANNRDGGVGDETAIISSEVYGKVNQEKFIPIIIEKDESGTPYVPTYIKSRIYIDLSDPNKYEDEYEKLLRNIYDKPTFKKPQLGAKPEWLEEDRTNLFPLHDLILQIKGANNSKKQFALIHRFEVQHLEILKTFYSPNIECGKQVYDAWSQLKGVRDYFLDWLDAILEVDCDFSDILCHLFENLYNSLTCVKTFDSNASSCSENEFELFKIYIWEIFICAVAFLRYHEKYDTLNSILTTTYFLIDSNFGGKTKPANYTKFRYYSKLLDNQYKEKIGSNLFTIMGNTLCCEREKKPIYTKQSLASADLFLYQVFNGLNFLKNNDISYYNNWFPLCYIC